jgi:predicted TIM-barrel fold metal-dependent hydrolase
MSVAESPRQSSSTGTAKHYRLIDVDVHPSASEGMASIYKYMPAAWRRRLELKKTHYNHQYQFPTRFDLPGGNRVRADAVPPGGGAPGSDPRFMRDDLLDGFHMDSVILSCLEGASFGQCLAQPDESTVLASAFNDYFINEWLSVDDRFKLAMHVTSQDPLAAAAEIRRVGGSPNVVAVYLPYINVLFGNRYFYPVYEAAQEYGLPIYAHITGVEFTWQGSAVNAGGFPETFSEKRCAWSQLSQGSISSLVFNGAFERFPGLKFVFVESGFAWAVPLLWRLDTTWRSLRIETPWLKESPSQYVKNHIRFATQPMDEPSDPQHMHQMIAMLGPEMLLFSSDYPHWDADEPTRVLQNLPSEWKELIFAQNAAEFFGL